MVHFLVFYCEEHPERNVNLDLNEDFYNILLKTLMKYLIINYLLFLYFIIHMNFKMYLFLRQRYLIFKYFIFNYFLSSNQLYWCQFIYLLFIAKYSSILSNYLFKFFNLLINFLLVLNLVFNYFYYHFLKYLEFFCLILSPILSLQHYPNYVSKFFLNRCYSTFLSKKMI